MSRAFRVQPKIVQQVALLIMLSAAEVAFEERRNGADRTSLDVLEMTIFLLIPYLYLAISIGLPARQEFTQKTDTAE
jgi:hypothetical protein